MKKLISLLLAMIMVFSLATVAFADDTFVDTSDWVSVPADQELDLYKLYTVNGNEDPSKAGIIVLPDEELTFVSTADSSNPDISDDVNLQVASIDYADMDKENAPDGYSYKGTMNITIPVYSEVGIYNYTITEVPGDAQGADYNIGSATIGIRVYVTYNYEDEKLDTRIVLTTPGAEDDNVSEEYDPDNSDDTVFFKRDTFLNEYNVGHLDVVKQVEGNLGDKTVEFHMTVTFTSGNPVKSDITIVDETNVTAPTDRNSDAVIDHDEDWTEEDDGTYTAVADIYVKHGETVKFYNIPEGVEYVVAEDTYHTELPKGQTVVNPNSDTDKEYTVDYDETVDGEIVAEDTATTTVTNTKETTVETGIALDSAPYFLMLAVALFGMVALVSKKRYEV